MEVLEPCVLAGTLLDVGSYPALVASDGRVVGELCRVVCAEGLAVLDSWEDHRPEDEAGSEYLRRRVRLREPDLEAWTYVLNREPADLPVVPNGDWVAHVAARGIVPHAARWR